MLKLIKTGKIVVKRQLPMIGTYDYTLSSLVSVQRDGLFLPSINLLFVDFCLYFSFGVS